MSFQEIFLCIFFNIFSTFYVTSRPMIQIPLHEYAGHLAVFVMLLWTVIQIVIIVDFIDWSLIELVVWRQCCCGLRCWRFISVEMHIRIRPRGLLKVLDDAFYVRCHLRFHRFFSGPHHAVSFYLLLVSLPSDLQHMMSFLLIIYSPTLSVG